MASLKLLSRVLVQGSKLFWTSGLLMFLFPKCGYTLHNLYCKDLQELTHKFRVAPLWALGVRMPSSRDVCAGTTPQEL